MRRTARAEIACRLLDGYRLGELKLVNEPRTEASTAADLSGYAKQIALDRTFDIAWYKTNPADYDRSPKYTFPADWLKAVADYKASPGEPDFVKEELKFIYNRAWLVEACETGAHSNVIRHYEKNPGFVYSFASFDGSVNPPYRIVPRGWDRGLDSYNNFGFRGPDISPHKPARVIRLAFLGASTTANGWPWTYPEYVAHFLRQWARTNRLGVDFDVINAGLGGATSPMIDAIMRYEVAPLHPDIVVYYEGANDLHTELIVQVPDAVPPPASDPSVLRPFMSIEYLPFERYSALLDRIYELLWRRGGPSAEPQKPPHTVTFDLTQKNPDIERDDLPFQLHRQIANLRDMADAARSVGAEFFLTSFVTLVHDGLRLDPERHRIILQGLNREYAPLTYAEIRQAVDFQNATYRKLAQTDHHPFLEIDRYFPQDPDFFADMVHFGTSEGFRLQAWIVAQMLAPYIRQAIAAGTLPKPAYDADPKEIAWATEPPEKFDLSCLK